MNEQSRFDFAQETTDASADNGPATCLGMTFDNDEARRAYFIEGLPQKLQDPEFRKIEGFRIGSDEDILNLSDPPYYAACPNPWSADFIADWEAQKPEQPEGNHNQREPFAADVGEGKNDPIYNAHSYHTKVQHKALIRYILHYTQPGDIVFDGFCGTGMTGVAAQMCGDREVVMSLGYQVKPDGTILQEETAEAGKKVWRPFSKLGLRRAVLNELSPAAAFIAYNYNTRVDFAAFEIEAQRILKEVEEEYGWMYETIHTDGTTSGRVHYTVWSDVFCCSECTHEITFWDIAVDKKGGQAKDEFLCPNCSASLTKRNIQHAWITYFDGLIGEAVKQSKRVPVLINYSAKDRRFEKEPDGFDISLISKIEASKLPHRLPSIRMIEGRESRRNDPIGLTHVHHYFSKRNLWLFLSIKDRLKSPLPECALVGGHTVELKTARFLPLRWIKKDTGPMKPHTTGTLYVPSLNGEQNWLNIFESRVAASKRAELAKPSYSEPNPISTNSFSHDTKPSESIDYIFLDPPFGSNISYSELNLFSESWLGVRTNVVPEAIESTIQNKGPEEYRHLTLSCFREAYRILKPGRWMTVESSNTKASVWNGIQVALTKARFIIANVSALDKKQGSCKAVTTPTAFKQDLVVSAYKPNGGFEERFRKEAQTEEGVWDFVRTHLKYLPVTKRQGELMLFVPERDPRILFDQMVAFYVRTGYPVAISSQEFQLGLAQRFIERDGMYFLPDQVAEYDRKKMTSGGLNETIEMFVKDEDSMIQWLRQLIKDKPQTFSDINPQFMQQLGGWSKNEAQLDLRKLLNQNFLCHDGKGPVPEQIHAYLSTNWKELRNLPKDDPALAAKARDRWYVPDPNKVGDVEKLREKAPLKEFEEYKKVKKKLKVFRLEAVRADLKKAWQERDYAVIVAVADKIPNNVLEEDPRLLMWYDQAVTRMGGA
jgi:16S rRNA G966 N2-methylase RsmD